MIIDYWMSPSAELVEVKGSHKVAAREIASRFMADLIYDPSEILMRRGWLRVVACRHSGNIFYERRVEPNEKQLGRLKDLAIEHRCRLEHEGHTVYDPAGEVVPF